MPESFSEKRFSDDETARNMLTSLWTAIVTNEVESVVGLINGLSDLVLKWDQPAPADQGASNSTPVHDQYQIAPDFLSQIFDFDLLEASSMVSEPGGVELQGNSTPPETSTSVSDVVAGSDNLHSPNVSPIISATRCGR